MVRNLPRGVVTILVALLAAGCAGGGSLPSESPGQSIAPTGSPVQTSSPSSTQRVVATYAPPTALPLAPFPDLPTAELGGATAAGLQAALDGLLTGGQPDAVASVITPEGQWSGAAGIDGPDGRLAKPTDMFNIASVGKTILAATIMRLAEDGKIDLDSPLADYLGDLPVDANRATVRQALGMRSGIGDTPGAATTEARADCSRIWTQAEVLAWIPAPTNEAGHAYVYSNPTYKLLMYAAEHVEGAPIGSVLREQVLTPLGLERILLQGPDSATPQPWALPLEGHTDGLPVNLFGTGGTLPCVSLSTFSLAASGMAGDAPSLAQWAWGLFAGDLLSADSLLAMTTPDAGGHGLGIDRMSGVSSEPALGFVGHQAGYAAILVVLPGRSTVVVYLVNDDNVELEVGARRLIAALGP